jgi:hypothetical protein
MDFYPAIGLMVHPPPNSWSYYEGENIMMDGFGGSMGMGGFGMWLIAILVLLAIAALVKYLIK